MELIKAQKGTQDILPGQSENWQVVEDADAQRVAALHGFGEIRTPVFEDTRPVPAVGREKPPTWCKRRCTPSRIRAGARSPCGRRGRRARCGPWWSTRLYNDGLPVKAALLHLLLPL